uniref:PI3K/PI4K domain-containing protein n=1 Tax=Steinernema glaseri TaxID=37863 RepID=A0A1I7ZAH6_9BILA
MSSIQKNVVSLVFSRIAFDVLDPEERGLAGFLEDCLCRVPGHQISRAIHVRRKFIGAEVLSWYVPKQSVRCPSDVQLPFVLRISDNSTSFEEYTVYCLVLVPEVSRVDKVDEAVRKSNYIVVRA